MPVEDVPEVLREIDALIERKGWTISFPVEVRAAAADDLWMSTATAARPATSPCTGISAKTRPSTSPPSRRS